MSRIPYAVRKRAEIRLLLLWLLRQYREVREMTKSPVDRVERHRKSTEVGMGYLASARGR